MIRTPAPATLRGSFAGAVSVPASAKWQVYRTEPSPLAALRSGDQAARAGPGRGGGRQERHRLRLAAPQLRARAVPDGEGPPDRRGEGERRCGPGWRRGGLHHRPVAGGEEPNRSVSE